jgi:hypothetical protein
LGVVLSNAPVGCRVAVYGLLLEQVAAVVPISILLIFFMAVFFNSSVESA